MTDSSAPVTVPAVAIRATGNSLNPHHLEESPYFGNTWVAYVLFKQGEARTRPTRIVTSHGGLGLRVNGTFRYARVGDFMTLVDDQTSRYLGEYLVVGISRADNGAKVGDLPRIKIKHSVAK